MYRRSFCRYKNRRIPYNSGFVTMTIWSIHIVSLRMNSGKKSWRQDSCLYRFRVSWCHSFRYHKYKYLLSFPRKSKRILRKLVVNIMYFIVFFINSSLALVHMRSAKSAMNQTLEIYGNINKISFHYGFDRGFKKTILHSEGWFNLIAVKMQWDWKVITQMQKLPWIFKSLTCVAHL